MEVELHVDKPIQTRNIHFDLVEYLKRMGRPKQSQGLNLIKKSSKKESIMTIIRRALQTSHTVEPSKNELRVSDIHDPEFNENVKESLMNDNATEDLQKFKAYLAKAAELQNNPDNIDPQTHNSTAQPPVVRITTITGPFCYSGTGVCRI